MPSRHFRRNCRIGTPACGSSVIWKQLLAGSLLVSVRAEVEAMGSVLFAAAAKDCPNVIATGCADGKARCEFCSLATRRRGCEIVGTGSMQECHGTMHHQVESRKKGHTIWEFPNMGVPYLGVLIIRILLFRVLYWDPLFLETPICTKYGPVLLHGICRAWH